MVAYPSSMSVGCCIQLPQGCSSGSHWRLHLCQCLKLASACWGSSAVGRHALSTIMTVRHVWAVRHSCVLHMPTVERKQGSGNACQKKKHGGRLWVIQCRFGVLERCICKQCHEGKSANACQKKKHGGRLWMIDSAGLLPWVGQVRNASVACV